MTPGDEDRLRTHPRERFRPEEEVIDLAQVTQKLLSEPASGRHGHRQMALFHGGGETLALFCFDAGSELPMHKVDGPVMIQVLEGRLRVRTDEAEHDLKAGQLLRLGAGVRHDVTADEFSRMLLVTFLNPAYSHGGG